ncbi:MAG: hypothetical protein QOE16_545 [Microbacteriaceae bacterium]|nr:hypothetical protein [Microbacteriaceae bacterium]
MLTELCDLALHGDRRLVRTNMTASQRGVPLHVRPGGVPRGADCQQREFQQRAEFVGIHWTNRVQKDAGDRVVIDRLRLAAVWHAPTVVRTDCGGHCPSSWAYLPRLLVT